MNVLIIPSWYVSEKNPISGTFFREQAIALTELHNVYVMDVTLQPRNNYFSSSNFRFKKFKDHNLHVYSFTIPALGIGRKPSLNKKVSEFLAKRVMKKLIKDNISIDIIHAHSYLPAGCIALMLNEKYGIPYVITEHSSSILKHELDSYKQNLLKETLNRAQKFICVSNNLANEVQMLTKSTTNISVIPNMISNDFKYQELEKNNHFKFISVGNLNANKNHLLLLKLFKKVFISNKEVTLTIIGDGPCRQELEAYVKDHGLEAQVDIVGKKNKNDVVQYLKESNCFILLSTFETFGIAYAEAMAVGRPVIATRNGGANDIVNEKCGLLIDNSESCIIKAMLDIYENFDNYNLKEISENCISQFSSEKVVYSLTEVYNQALEKEEK